MNYEEAILYSELPAYQQRVEATISFIRYAIELVENPYVACSFGKDSAVVLHLVRQVLPNIPVIFVRRVETDLMDNYDEVISAWGLKNLRILSYTGWLEDSYAGQHLPDTLKHEAKEYDSFFVGLRAEESWGRRVSLRKYGLFHRLRDGKVRIAPIGWWGLKDVICYVLINNLPILNKYKVEGFEARTTAAIPSKFPHESLASLKKRDLTAYNKLLKLLPEARYYG